MNRRSLPKHKVAIETKAILEITKRVVRITVLPYRLVQLVLLPFVILYFLARLVTRREYRAHFAERLGFLPQSFSRTESGSLWLHAVSVGEVLSAMPLIRELRKQVPRAAIYVSTSTVAGRKAGERELAAEVDGIFYAPIDYPSCVRRALSAIRPATLVILETEIWPNLFRESARAGCGLAIANGRISSRAWPRYRAFRAFFRPVVSLAQILFVQSETDCERYAELGADPNRILVEGNVKFDAAIASGPPPFERFGASHVWIAASTVGPNERGSIESHNIDEDDLVIAAFQQLAADFPKLLLILAPRQPARFDEVARKLEAAQVTFVRRTQLPASAARAIQLPGILLLDTIGELGRAYQLADVVFVGGSIAPRGGHNIIEPASAGRPIVIGPYMQNFEAITRDFLASEAVVQISGAGELASSVRALLSDAAEARSVGARARRVCEMRRGASRRVAEKIASLYFASQYRRPRNPVTHLFLSALAALWRKGGVAKRLRSERASLAAEPLPVPVISIGGITMGGSGKTPLTVYLSAQLATRGYAPAILTRGYRRRSPSANLVLPAGTAASAAVTGDEAQIFLRSGAAPVGIGSNRYETARILLAHIPETGVFVLDDGFQHASLPRDIDIVVIDGLDPYGGGDVFPLGRLREPLAALARADMLVITRAESQIQIQAITERLRSYNQTAPVFSTRLLTKGWRNARTRGSVPDLPSRRVAAFCGLGNPANFFNTLESLGLDMVFRWSFGDHHSYTPLEISRVAHQARLHGAEALVTTEKDVANLPREIDSVLLGLEIAWLQVEMQVDDETGFFSALDQLLRHRQSARSRTEAASR